MDDSCVEATSMWSWLAIVVDKKVETATWFEPLEDSYIGANKEILGWACGRRMNSENDNSAA
ncbi:hypothetical protein QC762_0102770 [Podospora pseudocomata]|uniref:Uncharacterized protein n=1 Tax=Podospora pseudocomata TaxID=2093779 RepID=A0ABR0G9M7_9PEZI|nr:hypothetical protein QC762_0102770 [Podospora pseudocomata]